MNEQQAIREINATLHWQAQNRLKSEGLTFHNPELAYLYEAYREELHQWEKLVQRGGNAYRVSSGGVVRDRSSGRGERFDCSRR